MISSKSILSCLILLLNVCNSFSQNQHKEWTSLLQKYVTNNGEVDYRGFQKDSLYLNKYLKTLSPILRRHHGLIIKPSHTGSMLTMPTQFNSWSAIIPSKALKRLVVKFHLSILAGTLSLLILVQSFWILTTSSTANFVKITKIPDYTWLWFVHPNHVPFFSTQPTKKICWIHNWMRKVENFYPTLLEIHLQTRRLKYPWFLNGISQILAERWACEIS